MTPRTTLSAGIAVKEILSDVMPDKVFPLLADFQATKPCIVYQRDGIDVARDKDGIATEVCRMSVYVVTDNYGDGVTLAERARQAIEQAPESKLSRYDIGDVYFDGADEYMDGDTSTYIQQLYFNFCN